MDPAAADEAKSDNTPLPGNLRVRASATEQLACQDTQQGEQNAAQNEQPNARPTASRQTTKSSWPSGLLVSKFDHGWRRIVRNFSPSWFSVTMGTGIVAVLFISIPYRAHWLTYLSYIFAVLNAVLFLLAFLISFARYTLYPEIWTVMIQDPNNSLFLGCMPMGFATLIEMWLFACVPKWGAWAPWVSWIAWMLDAIIAAAVTVFLCFTHISRSEQSELNTMTATQLLPIAATIIAAGTGSEVAETLLPDHPQHALGTLITSFVMWGMGMPLAMTVLVIYYQRLAVHKLPPREVVVSCFLPIGPLSFGAYTIMYLGKVSRDLLPITHTLHPAAGDVLYIQGFIIALLLWGFGLVWLIFAVATIYISRPIPFNMGWWGFTFPLGVFAVNTIQIGLELSNETFKILGTISSGAVVLLWVVVAIETAKGAWTGNLFNAPCLQNLKKEDLDKGQVLINDKAA